MAEGRVVRVDSAGIVDWTSFHDVFAAAFGFPDWYGRNMDSWIDLFTRMDEETVATEIRVAGGETVTILLEAAADLKARAAPLYDAIVECVAFVNWRRIEAGNSPYLCLAFA